MMKLFMLTLTVCLRSAQLARRHRIAISTAVG